MDENDDLQLEIELDPVDETMSSVVKRENGATSAAKFP